MLHVVSSRTRPPPDTRRDLYAMCQKVLRIARNAVFHVAQAYEDGKGLLVDYLGYQASRAHEFRTRVHVNRIVADSMAQLLESKGFDRQHLPHCLGGDYDYNQFADWIRARMSVEDMLSSTPVMVNRISTPSTTLVVGRGPLDAPVQRKRPRDLLAAVTTATTESSQEGQKGAQDGETKAQLARQRNALYSRRSNRKKDLLMLSLQDQERLLRARNDYVRNDNARLEYLLAMAERCLSYHSGTGAGNSMQLPYNMSYQG